MGKPAAESIVNHLILTKAGLLQEIPLAGNDIPKLEALREKGRKTFAKHGLPTPKIETWKYTRLRELESSQFVIEPACNGSAHADCDCHCAHEKEIGDQKQACCCEHVKHFEHKVQHDVEKCCSEKRGGNGSRFHENIHHAKCPCESSLPFDAYEIKFENGKLVTDSFDFPDGIKVMSILDAIINHEAEAYLNKSFNMERYPFAALNTAYLEQGIFLQISSDQCLQKPIALLYHTDGDIKRYANLRNIIVLENGSQAELLEFNFCSGNEKSEYFNNIVNEIFLGRHAHFWHYKVQNEAFKSVHIALNSIRVKGNGKYESFTLQKGANLARNESHVSLKEEKAIANIYSAYAMGGWATLDTTTNIEHLAPCTYSNQLAKGVINGNAKGVFQGKISIAPNAVKTEGYQLHKALLLSDEAEVDVKPELEIFADDVKCSHGATCGELDKEQLFYLRSRGISEENAEQMLIRAFIDEAINKVTDEQVKEWLKSF